MKYSIALVLALTLLTTSTYGTSQKSRTVYAENTLNVNPQVEPTLQIVAFDKSWIRVIVDEKLVFIGRLRPPSMRQWTGQTFTVKTDNPAGMQITVNGSLVDLPASDGSTITFSWPENATPAQDSASGVAASSAKVDEVPTEENVTSEAIAGTELPEAIYESIEGESLPTEKIQEEQTVETTSYLVKPGDSLTSIAERFGIGVNTLVRLNNISNVNIITVGSTLVVPAAQNATDNKDEETSEEEALANPRGTVIERLTLRAQQDKPRSPFYRTTWLTYYGRPRVPIMGILGEYSIDQLTPLLRAQAEAYDEANGPAMDITPAYHLVYGMATKARGKDESHLAFMSEEATLAYIERAAEEGFQVILDVQIGALSPVDAMTLAFPMLQYDNVHLGLDPEFAMSHPNQYIPGSPPGFVTAEEVNEVQEAMQAYMEENKIKGVRVLLLHQFLASMITDKENLDYSYDKIALTISIDGWGPPEGKIVKYNRFVDESANYSAFKLFYGWDRPLMSERQALGIDPQRESVYINTTPNLIIYQ